MSRESLAIMQSTGRSHEAPHRSPDERARRERSYRFMKRTLDLALCIALLPIAIPVLMICAALVKLTSRGPILFVQERTGRGGHRFKMLKFRTMVPGAAGMKAGLADRNIMGGPDFKLADDPRVTRVGQLLRKTSLDEAPQIWNILRGDMSLVGPRPTSFEADAYDLWHTERLEVTPGLTGLWQIAGRGEIDFDDRVRLDIAYVRNCDLPLDISILLRTIPAVLSRRGAY